MNQAEGLYKVIRYVKTDFLMKVLKQNPEFEFNIKKLSRNQICEFIDEGCRSLIAGPSLFANATSALGSEIVT